MYCCTVLLEVSNILKGSLHSKTRKVVVTHVVERFMCSVFS